MWHRWKLVFLCFTVSVRYTGSKYRPNQAIIPEVPYNLVYQYQLPRFVDPLAPAAGVTGHLAETSETSVHGPGLSHPSRERPISCSGRHTPFCVGRTLSSSNSHLFIVFIFKLDFRASRDLGDCPGRAHSGREPGGSRGWGGEVTAGRDRDSGGRGSVGRSGESGSRLPVWFRGQNGPAKGPSHRTQLGARG